MNRSAQTVATTPTRPNRILIFLAAVWMAIAIAMGGFLTSEPTADVSASRITTGAAGTVQP